jgi:hypothetical protein
MSNQTPPMTHAGIEWLNAMFNPKYSGPAHIVGSPPGTGVMESYLGAAQNGYHNPAWGGARTGQEANATSQRAQDLMKLLTGALKHAGKR